MKCNMEKAILKNIKPLKLDPSIQIVVNCACGELVKDCAYPNCDYFESIKPKIKTAETKSEYCENCPDWVVCSKLGCQWQ